MVAGLVAGSAAMATVRSAILYLFSLLLADHYLLGTGRRLGHPHPVGRSRTVWSDLCAAQTLAGAACLKLDRPSRQALKVFALLMTSFGHERKKVAWARQRTLKSPVKLAQSSKIP